MAEIRVGSKWRRKKDGKVVTVERLAPLRWSTLKLRWPHGGVTYKRAHYFLYEFEEVSDGQ